MKIMREERKLVNQLKDCSTDKKFQFLIVCEECRTVWKSRKISFSEARILPKSKEKKNIYAVLYQREKEEVKLKALVEAQKVFSLCPICNKWVCDECFMICEELDMCKECAVKLNETGSVVNEKVNVRRKA